VSRGLRTGVKNQKTQTPTVVKRPSGFRTFHATKNEKHKENVQGMCRETEALGEKRVGGNVDVRGVQWD
jgi:hypothetical protein